MVLVIKTSYSSQMMGTVDLHYKLPIRKTHLKWYILH